MTSLVAVRSFRALSRSTLAPPLPSVLSSVLSTSGGGGNRLRRMAPQPTILSLFNSVATKTPSARDLKRAERSIAVASSTGDDAVAPDAAKSRKRLRRKGDAATEPATQDENGKNELDDSDNNSEMNDQDKDVTAQGAAQEVEIKTKVGRREWAIVKHDLPLIK